MHYKALFKGENISAAEFGDRSPMLTIESVKPCKLEQDNGKHKEVGVVNFKETERGWILNKTNAICLAAMFGDDTVGWTGKRVVLFATMVKFGGRPELGIRVKGSPDISETVTATIKLPRKRPFDMLLEKTAAKDAS